jgi:hypothetical protein
MLRKIPLGPIIEILQELYENGADYIDISGEASDGGESPRDTVKITVKAEYLADHNEDDALELEQEIEMDYSDDLEPPSSLSDDDINELI